MSRKRFYWMAAAAVTLVAAAYAAAPWAFVPDSRIPAASLAGWHTLGQADWRADNGEIVGTPKTAGGGWLVLDKSYQDVGFFTSFKCASGCKTGVLFRAEKAADGMKGVFVSLNEGDLASYSVKLDALGQEVSREPLERSGGTVRYTALNAGRGGAAGGRGRGGAAGGAGRMGAMGGGGSASYGGRAGLPIGLRAEEWNTVQVILDADIIRPSLNEAGASGGGNTGIAGGATADQSSGFGPVALYVGGTGEVRFKDVAFKNLRTKEEPAEQVSSNFRMQRISDFYYGWSAAAADFNHDGILDIAAGPYIYLGPDYTKREEFTLAQTFNPSTQYASGMVNFAYDYTGDGWPDILMTDSRPIALYVNPQGEARRWNKYMVLPDITTEEVLFRDVDGDGKPEVVYGGRGVIAYAKPDPADPTKPWIEHAVSDKVVVNAHGIGVGDINGDGRMDILTASGWYEQPARGADQGPWIFHPEYFGRGGAEMSVYDVNGDGLADVVTSIEAHGWGVSWFEQKRDKDGTISFVEHPIMGDLASKSAGGVVFSQPHASTIADIDGDGIPDLIVGKRFWSHEESYADPDPYGPAVLYWYRTVRNPKAPGGAEFVPELIHNRSGVGSHFQVVDLNHDGAMDIITSGDRGTFIFWGKPRGSKAKLTAHK
jgi:Domain of Unknown Function (DUF1080)/FG-GAP-like repeat